MRFILFCGQITLVTLLFCFNSLAQSPKPLTLANAIQLAQTNDPWLQGNQLKQRANEAKKIAANNYDNPMVSLSLVNLPTDSFSLSQEGMTQLKVGISQRLPRGNTLAIKQAQFSTMAAQFPLLQLDRQAKRETEVTQLWLEVFLAQQTIVLIVENQALFEQMVDITAASYASAYGSTKQQDLIRSQWELSQLTDRLTTAQQKMDTAMAQLNEWLYGYNAEENAPSLIFGNSVEFTAVADQLPHISAPPAELLTSMIHSPQDIAVMLTQHPALQVVAAQQQIANKNTDLAKQKAKPQWGVNASYGYRDSGSMDNNRADLFSVGVSVDLPLFTQDNEEQLVAASIAESEVYTTEKLLLMRRMFSQMEKEIRLLQRLSQRRNIYASQLLPQAHEQAETALTAYTNDEGRFSDVVRARISELDTRIRALTINIEQLKAQTRLNYFLVSTPSHLAVTGGDHK